MTEIRDGGRRGGWKGVSLPRRFLYIKRIVIYDDRLWILSWNSTFYLSVCNCLSKTWTLGRKKGRGRVVGGGRKGEKGVVGFWNVSGVGCGV